VSTVTVLLVGLASGCPDPDADAGGTSPPARTDPTAAARRRIDALADDPSAIFAADPDALEADLMAVVGALDGSATPAQGRDPAFLRRAGEVARGLAYRRSDPRLLDLAEELLRGASRRDGSDGNEGCLAALDAARIAAMDRDDPREAYRRAYVAGSRFADAGDATCLAGLDAVMAATERFRPSPDELAAAIEGTEPVAPSSQVEDETGGPARLEGIRVLGGSAAGSGVRVVLGFDAPPALEVGQIPREEPLPKRTWIDVAGGTLSPDVPGSTTVGSGGLRRVRVGQRTPEVLRVVLDLFPGAETRVLRLPGASRVWVDVVAAGAGRGRGQPRLVVLDPGHGGDDHGARAGELREADLALDLARRAARALEAYPEGFRALLTRDEDVEVDLEARTAFANAVGADLFVSIHLNSSDEPVQRGGITTFVLDTTDDEQAIRLAARENGTTRGRVTRLQRLLAGLHRAGQVEASRRLAGTVQERMLEAGRERHAALADRGVKEAGFHVLVGARMPAVLVEASFLTHPPDAEALESPDHREALATGLAEAIRRYAVADPE